MRLLGRLLDGIVALAKRQENNEFFYGYTITNGTTPYLTRVIFPRIFGRRVMLHRIHREDGDREMHNHPWDQAMSVILTGGYDEERLEGLSRRTDGGVLFEVVSQKAFKPFSINRINRETFHRITELHGETWTLFIAGERVQTWGFLDLTAGKFIPHTEWFRRT